MKKKKKDSGAAFQKSTKTHQQMLKSGCSDLALWEEFQAVASAAVTKVCASGIQENQPAGGRSIRYTPYASVLFVRVVTEKTRGALGYRSCFDPFLARAWQIPKESTRP